MGTGVRGLFGLLLVVVVRGVGSDSGAGSWAGVDRRTELAGEDRAVSAGCLAVCDGLE